MKNKNIIFKENEKIKKYYFTVIVYHAERNIGTLNTREFEKNDMRMSHKCEVKELHLS